MISKKILKVFFILLISMLTIPSISTAIDKQGNYCDDPTSWQQWNKLLTDNPDNDGIASLYSFRVGPCSMVKSGKIQVTS